ncbi:MAG: nuclease-related domain-containing protein [Candidatus Tumulicola sp.]
MKPRLSDAELRQVQSRAEAKFYKWCTEQLDDTFIVLHSREWINRDERGAHEGETDFTICSADSGLIVIEVKGGWVRIDDDRQWYSLDRNSVAHRIKNPFGQARDQRHEFEKALECDGAWRKGGSRVTVGYAVFFPNVIDATSLVDIQERPRALIGGSQASTQVVSGGLDLP